MASMIGARAEDRRAPRLSRYRTDTIARGGVVAAALLLIVLLLAVYVFIASKAFLIFGKVSPITFFFDTRWDPEGNPALHIAPHYGAGAIILGSVSVVLLALLIALPLSLGAALFLEQTDRELGERLLRPVIEVFVGIPSVVYGWVGLTVLVPYIARNADAGAGLCVLAGGLVLSVMIVPTITSLSADALRRLEPSLAESSYALGATRWQTIWRVLLPAARPGIVTGAVFGLARAMGEALAVAMVVGNVPNVPRSLFIPIATMTTIITQDLPNRALNPDLNNALYTLALVLLFFSLVFILIVRRVTRGQNR
jgi:phosphate transport system permease protein